jgi:hypothetical protein
MHPMRHFAIRRWAHLASIFAIAALVSACDSECDRFYEVYESCGYADPGEDVAQMRKSCQGKIDKNEDCENDYKVLNACINNLNDECSYPDGCSKELNIAALRCNN